MVSLIPLRKPLPLLNRQLPVQGRFAQKKSGPTNVPVGLRSGDASKRSTAESLDGNKRKTRGSGIKRYH